MKNGAHITPAKFRRATRRAFHAAGLDAPAAVLDAAWQNIVNPQVSAAIDHLHHSSRFSRSVATLRAALEEYRRRHTVITLTEMASEDRAKALDVEGWAFFRGKGRGADECAVTWDLAEWRELYGEAVQLTKFTFHGATGHEHAPLHAATVVLEARNGAQWIVSVAHLANDAQEGDWNDPTPENPRTRAYKDAVPNWSRHIEDVQKQYPTAKVMVVADWNLPLDKTWVRDYLHKAFAGPGLTLTWNAPYPEQGTFGPNLIDGTLSDGEVLGEPRVLPLNDSSDHRPYDEKLA